MTQWRVALQPGATVLSPGGDLVASFDLEGRLKTLFDRGTLIKRSLGSELHARRRHDATRQRWRVDEAAAAKVFDRALAVAQRAAAQPAARRAAAGEEAVGAAGGAAAREGEFGERLERILSWTPGRLAAERRRFARAYAPISILPPDQYGAIVVQGTFGCSWNRCSFCSFYQDRPFELRPPEAIAQHLEAVAELLGRDAASRRSIFLADGNALVLSNARLEPLFRASRRAFPGRPIASFVDALSGEKKPSSDYAELRSWGLERVAVGLESGHEPLLRFIQKPASTAASLEFIATLKGAGLRVQAIFMVGVGGRRFAEGHLRDSLALIEALPLGAGDTLYLSPFVLHGDSAYASAAACEGIEPLSAAEMAVQHAALATAAKRAHPRLQVARYPINEFLY